MSPLDEFEALGGHVAGFAANAQDFEEQSESPSLYHHLILPRSVSDLAPAAKHRKMNKMLSAPDQTYGRLDPSQSATYDHLAMPTAQQKQNSLVSNSWSIGAYLNSFPEEDEAEDHAKEAKTGEPQPLYSSPSLLLSPGQSRTESAEYASPTLILGPGKAQREAASPQQYVSGLAGAHHGDESSL
jgi:hypothetical protein